ncbi:putative histidine-binding protein [termite gut metagenome]|uniref:Putative histidine-binding protein n=1 Tax=termite gut metagenome TaxID=433724 RepID=A0A5J4SRA7_9ZZZZ
MRKKHNLLKYFILSIIAVTIALIWSLHHKEGEDKKQQIKAIIHLRDYDAIVAEGIVRATVEYNSTGFYVDKDSFSGFHYELLKIFAQDKGLKLEIIPEMSFDKRMRILNTGKCDIIAHEIATISELKDSLLLTVPIMLSKSILVQRKPSERDSSSYIESLLNLGGKTIHLVKGSPSVMRIRNLENEIGDTIYIKEVEKYGQEQLMAMVAHSDIDYAVCDEHVARVLADSLPNLSIDTEISFTQFYSWGVNNQSFVLADSLNNWLIKVRKSSHYKQIYRKYLKKEQ